MEPSSRSLVAGIGGGTGSGKTTLVRGICAAYPEVSVLDQDSYYVDHSGLPAEERERLNFDHPSAIDHKLLLNHVQRLVSGKAVEKPDYCFVSHRRKETFQLVHPAPLILVEGIFALWDPSLRALMSLKVYVDVDLDIRFICRLQRDVLERGRTVESVIRQYLDSARPMHEAFIEPTKTYADLVVNRADSLPRVLSQIRDTLGSVSTASVARQQHTSLNCVE